jgi:hypothetical protein
MNHPDEPESDGLYTPRRRWVLSLGIQLVAMAEGALAGGAQAGIVGALKGALVGAVFGPPFIAMAWALRRDRRRLMGVLLFGAIYEAYAVFTISLQARWFAAMPLLVILLLVALFAFLPWIIRAVTTWILQEKRWTIGGAIAGAAAGVIVGVIMAAAQLAQQRMRADEAAVFVTVCILPGLILGAATGAVLGATGRAKLRALAQARFRNRCREARSSQVEATATQGRLDLGDLDALAGGPAEGLAIAVLIVQALRDGDRLLRLEPLRNCCRLWRQANGAPVEQIPLELPPAVASAWLTSHAVLSATPTAEARIGRLSWRSRCGRVHDAWSAVSGGYKSPS